MTNDASSSISRRSGGVRHRPEADIESIRDLLRGGYGSERSILKELIQNAEDAESSRMDVLHLPGDPTSPHSLLRGPGLLVVNNGAFIEEHRDAISQISLGTKGTEDRAIGRFGKGLKSVFAWCDAFFIIARTDPERGWPGTYISDLFNPWHGWRHSEWDAEFDSFGDILVSGAEQHLDPIYRAGKSWLALWFPLRCHAHGAHAAEEWIYQLFPGDDPEFYQSLGAELRSLTPSLVSLRSLEHIGIVDRNVDSHESLILDFPRQSQRIPAPDTAPGTMMAVNGKINLRTVDDRNTPFQYCGLAGRLHDEEVANLKAAGDWPLVVQRTRGQNSASCPVKGEPHFATLITWGPVNEDKLHGSLDVRWCVFFPVGRQPPGKLPVKLSSIRSHITINLHGFFFLDSERLRVDGLEERFSPNGTAATTSCLEWNRIVATEGTLARLPEAVAAFAKRESFTNLKCRELGDALRQTWVWSSFQEAICHLETWRPRWRSGTEAWECIPAETHVLLVPNTSEPREVLARIPMLVPISENFTLIARDDDGSLPGLHYKKESLWSEDLVLQLLKDVQLSSTGDEATAAWLNVFLNHLHERGALTPAIRDGVSVLPLLAARVARGNTPVRLSAREWLASVAADHLFAPDNQTDVWIGLLCAALPDWSCRVASSGGLPPWFTGSRPPICDGTIAAKIVLTQTSLGSFVHRTKLVEAFASLAHRDSGLCLAMRFLMHASAPHAHEDAQLLFMPSTQHDQQIWTRLIEQLLKNDGGTDSWRLLHDQWAPVLSTHLQRELNVSTIDAGGAWAELMKGQVDLHELEFPPDHWSTNDVCALLQGLFQAGQARQNDTVTIMRKLRLHTLRGHPNERVSVADGEGHLAELFVLDTPNFEAGLTPGLQPLWQQFLSETKIVERLPDNNLASTVQRQIFGRADADGNIFLAELDWNYVVRRSLEAAAPSERAPLILEALSHGDQAARGLGQKLKSKAWLPLALGGSIAPDSVVHIEGLEDDLHRLLDPVKDGLAGIRALPKWISTHDGFATLRNYLPRVEQALELLGLWLADKSEWHLGLSKEFQPTELEPILSQLEGFENLPVATLLAKLRRIRVRGLDEGIDPLLRNYIFPAVLKRFDYEQDGVERVGTILRRLQGQQSRFAFDAYLAQACKDRVLESILPTLLLVNQRGQWVATSQLIWPSTNLDPAAQLCFEQSEILAPFHYDNAESAPQTIGNHQGPTQIQAHQLAEEPDFKAQTDILSQYLQPFRTGNVGENLPAALVAVLGGHPSTLALLRELLQAGLGQQPEDFVRFLLGEQRDYLAEPMSAVRFRIEIVGGARTEVRSITGDKIAVEFTNEITTLLVGDPSDLWKSYYYHSRMETACHLLRLRRIENPDELPDLVAVFGSTIETILLKAHCNGVSTLCPTNIKEVLGEIADAGQADLRRSRSYLLDVAEARLKELGVREVPKLEAVLEKFTAARQARVDGELFEHRAPARAHQRNEEARKLVESAKRELVGLLESDQENTTRRTLVDAVRRKMRDFQYSCGSVAFELFQNADDALAELEEMQNGLDPKAQQFVLHLDSVQKMVEIFHWGRPINRHGYPGFQQGLKRGYDQDLQKMLTMNFSDKGVHAGNGPAMVTGRFGLGFKSVFFVSEQPEVISGRLAFEIRGGFFPVPLSQAAAEELRDNARKLGAPGLVPTAIRLKWAQDTEVDALLKAIDNFTRIAPLLTIFSHRIHTLILAQDGATKTWTKVEEKLTDSGRVTRAQIGNMTFCCFRCPLRSDQRPATVLFQLDSSGISHLADDMTGLWITTPTAERADLGWALNAPFSPDVGRQRLALTNPENRRIAEEISHVWGEALIELFDETSKNWSRFAQHLGLQRRASFESWWQQFWSETTRSSPILRWELIREGGQVLNWTAWGKSTGAMRRLVQQRTAIPSELPGDYVKMLKQEDVHFCISGLLAETANGCFAQVAQWESTKRAFPAGQTVHEDVGAFLQQAECMADIVSVTLERVLAAEVGPQYQVNHLVGERVGALLTDCKSVFEPNTPYAVEVQHLLTWMKQMTLLASDRTHHPANELICNRILAGVIEVDEALRAAFAPDSALLSASYSDTALSCFIRARGQLTASATILGTWVREASPEKLPAVFKYLIGGELGQQLADQLGRPWLDTNKATSAWQKLPAEDQQEVDRKFLKGYQWTFTPIVDLTATKVEIKQVMDAESAFCLVSQWWQEEQATWVARYEEKTYPAGFPGTLPWPGEDEWDTELQPSAQASWLILFIHAALVPLGFNKIGRDQSFSQFLVSKKWLDVFAIVSDKPEALLAALDHYLGGFIQNTQYHFQMRQFIAFYAVARNLEPLLLSLKEAERSQIPGAFHLAFCPRANPALTGTGIDAPPLTGMLGIGSCQLLRELYRLGRLANPLGYRFAFTPIRKVRRLCTQLFGIPEGFTPAQSSEMIFEKLNEWGERLGLDPTFNRCFDLPLQFLAQDGDLRTRVLKVTFEAESSDDETLDGAPYEESIP